MSDKNLYQRMFFIFSQEDAGFGAGQEPSGYVKIEAVDSKGKLAAYVQNLKEEPNRLEYKVYLLKCDEKKVGLVCAGTIPLKKNKGELHWEFNPSNVAMTGIRMEEFNTAAVLAEYKDRKTTNIQCPLVSHKDQKYSWREKLKDILYPEKQREEVTEQVEKRNPIEKEMISKYVNPLESKYIAPEDEQSSKNAGFENSKDKAAGGSGQKFGLTAEELLRNYEPQSMKESQPPVQESKQEADTGSKAKEKEEQRDITVNMQDAVKADKPMEYPDFREYEKLLERNLYENTGADMSKLEGLNLKPGCSVYSQQFSTAHSAPCANCQITCEKREEARTENGLSGMDRLKKELERYFEVYTPFQTRRRDYKWWKVGSPVHLNNILYMCNIKTPLLFNPKVMMAHFKYRYIIIGVYTDRVRRREYIVCGVPGVYGVDDRAFGDVCRWVQVEGSRPKYGAFGYWIVYIDPRSGKLLNAN